MECFSFRQKAGHDNEAQFGDHEQLRHVKLHLNLEKHLPIVIRNIYMYIFVIKECLCYIDGLPNR